MGLTFNAISTSGGSSGALSDTFDAVGANPKSIYIKHNSGVSGTHYTVPNGRKWAGYIRCSSGSPIVNGSQFDQNDFTSNQYYGSGNAIIRLNSGDTIGSTGYLAIAGVESSL